MGKASSSKKVARAARAGSTHKGPERRELGFPLAILVTVVLGTSLVLYSRGNRSEAVEPFVNSTHWHAAYGFYDCDKWLPALNDPTDANGNDVDPDGIHTHGDGVIHIHPYNSAAAGTRARLGVFFATVGVKASDSKIERPDGTVLEKGSDCNGKPTVLKVARFNADDPNAQPEIITAGFNDIRFRHDREAFTIARVPEDATIPRPESIPQLDQLTDVPGATTGPSTTVAPGETTTTAPGTPAPTTTAAGTPAPTTTAG
jgi:hypothetical protein